MTRFCGITVEEFKLLVKDLYIYLGSKNYIIIFNDF